MSSLWSRRVQEELQPIKYLAIYCVEFAVNFVMSLLIWKREITYTAKAEEGLVDKVLFGYRLDLISEVFSSLAGSVFLWKMYICDCVSLELRHW